MFNSRKINNDPFPYVSESGTRHANPGWMGSEYFSNRRERPEYDNNPNPILEAFREDIYAVGTVQEARNCLRYWDLYLKFVKKDWTFRVVHINHARKVLTRLVNVYGGQNDEDRSRNRVT